MMKILGIVFIYNPNELSTMHNIDKYANCLTQLIVWNNTKRGNRHYEEMFSDRPYFNKLLFLGGNGNKGLSKPINAAIYMALEDQYDCLLTMDQDSLWINFDQYLDIINKDEQFRDKIFIPAINDKEKIYDKETELYNGIFINSGAVYGYNALSIVGLMDEHFFVEGIDTDYSIRAIIKHVPIIKVLNGKMLQNKEDGVLKYKRLIFWHLEHCKYNAQRLYGISFSEVVMIRKFPEPFKSQIKRQFSKLFGWRMILYILFFGKEKCKRISYYFKGIIDGYKLKIQKSE
jgi:rhamnosyltransferase